MLPIAVGSLMSNLTTLIDLATIVRYLGKLPEGEILSRYNVQTDSISGFVYGSYTGLAITIFNLVPSVTNMLSKGALPNVVTSWQCGDYSTLKRDVSDTLSLTALIAVPSGMGISCLAKQILTFLYPNRLDEVLVSYESLAYMGLGVVCLCMAYPLFSILQGVNRADLPIRVMLVGVVVKLLGNVVLLSIPSVAVYGAGISTSVCYLVVFILAYLEFTKVTKVKINLVRLTLPILYASTMCSASAVLCDSLISKYCGSSSLALVVGILSGGGVYVLTLYLLGFKSSMRSSS
jgi:stage V sporulation protein B